MAQFSQAWTSELDSDLTWQLLAQSFRDSRKSEIWPRSMAEIVARGPLAVGQLLDVTYKLGPARTRVQYRITRYEPGRLLRYETTDRHPLSGYATVTVLSVGGASLCGWEGEYRVKRWWSFASLAWFKLWYEPVFFGRLRIAFKRREALASRARAAA